MTIKDIKEALNLRTDAEESLMEKYVKGCYIGDLLSLAMSKIKSGNVWITIQTNVNIVAVAMLTDAACIIVADDCVPDDAAIEKAKSQGVALLSSTLSAYELATKLSEMGI